MKNFIVVLLLFLPTISFAQDVVNDPAFLTRAIDAIKVQREQMADQAAINQARAVGLAAELEKLKAENEELKKKVKQ